MDSPDPEQLREADRSLAKRAWQLVWNRKTPLFVTLGVAVVFTVRVFVCQYKEQHPSDLDFDWYGNHCGPGHGTGGEAIDELDEACKRHDKAYMKAGDSSTKFHENSKPGELPMTEP